MLYLFFCSGEVVGIFKNVIFFMYLIDKNIIYVILFLATEWAPNAFQYSSLQQNFIAGNGFMWFEKRNISQSKFWAIPR